MYSASAGAGAVYYGVVEYSKDLPENLTNAVDYRPDRATRVFSADGELIGEFYLIKRIVVAPERIPDHVRNAFVAAEDGRFWKHPGFDLVGIVRAAYTNYAAGGTRQGASTITQQVTRMLMLSAERTYARKIKELILSVRVERELAKKDILHIYVNHVYLGSGAYGVEAGAEVYFGKDVSHLTIAESAMLAGLVQAPTRYSPRHNMKSARTRQRYVLARMLNDGYITEAEHAAARAEPLALVERKLELNSVSAPYFVELIRRWATRRFGYRNVFYGGLRIYTTLDSRMQFAAEAAVQNGLENLDRRIGFRGPIGHLEGDELTAFRDGPPRPYVENRQRLEELAASGGLRLLDDVSYVAAVVDMARGRVVVDLGPEDLALTDADARRLLAWRDNVDPETGRPLPGKEVIRLQPGDLLPVSLAPPTADEPANRRNRRRGARSDDGARRVQLAQVPDVQSALVAMEPHTGRVVSMVGGYDYGRSQFNRVTQARRQIGSAIKPFIYATAMERGITHLEQVVDSPVSVPTAAGWWRPRNYDNKYRGRVTLRTALAKSLNTVSVRLLMTMGVDRLIETLRAVGIGSEIPRHISIALGTSDLTLLEVAGGYSAFANGGRRTEPRMVDLVADDSGRIVEDYRSRRPSVQAISPQLAFLTTKLMETVVQRGTGKRAQALGRPVAGKTGTSTEHRDAWFMGFTRDLMCGVWVGRDDFTPIGAKATGGGAALPIWLEYMQAAHPDTPVRPFLAPDDIVWVRADEQTGQPMPAASSWATWVPFTRGTVPARFGTGIYRQPFRETPSRFP